MFIFNLYLFFVHVFLLLDSYFVCCYFYTRLYCLIPNDLRGFSLFYTNIISIFFFKGKYIFIETSAPRHPGDQAVLQSATFPSTTGQCMQFWYNMYGATIGSLSVSVLVQGSSSPTKVWELLGTQGNQWKNAQVNIVSNKAYQVSSFITRLIDLIHIEMCSI